MTTEELPSSDRVGRYADLAAGARIVIYDREHHRAWIQSDSAYDLAERR